MIELSDDDLLPRMSLLLSPKSSDYAPSPPVSQTSVSEKENVKCQVSGSCNVEYVIEKEFLSR